MTKPRLKHELPTPEATAKGVFVEQAMTAAPGSPKRVRRLDSDALDAALYAGLVSMEAHCTLEAFRSQLYKAGLVFCPRAGTEVAGTSGQGMYIADNAFSRARRVHKQMDELAGAMTAKELSTLLAILTMDEKIKSQDVDMLTKAVGVLDALADR